MGALSEHELGLVDAYWRAANYLSVAQIYLLDNPLLREPLQPEHVKPRLLGHFGTVPGLNLLYAHLNRQIRTRDLSAIYVTGPGHGGPALVANAYLEGTYSELYPNVSRDVDGLRRLFRQFSFPGGIPSHVAPEVPGSIHEGGELGYALVHAFGAAFDNPDLLVACVVGDGEAETGPLAASWHSNKLLNPETDGAVLPVLHLNGFKIANPTVLARIPERELIALFEGYGWRPLLVSGGFEGEEPAHVHQRLAAALDEALDEIRELQRAAREDGAVLRPTWPMLILRTPKGWTGPKEVDGKKTEGSWRSHQVPMAAVRENPAHVRVLEDWLRSYRPEELFDEGGRLVPELVALAPEGERRMSANPHANGGELLRELVLPDFRDYAVEVTEPATRTSEATRVLGGFLRDIVARNQQTFRLFGPDETASNRLGDVFSVTGRTWLGEIEDGDEGLTPDGRVMEILSEHLCQGWLEGYLLTGRHGLFNCYEAFIHIVDSMFNQHAKWLKMTREIPWRRPIASLNYLLSLARLAAGSQRLLAPGPWLHRPRRQQEGGGDPRLPAAGREHAALGRRPLPAQPQLRERDRRGQAARARLSLDRRRDRALHARARDLGVGVVRRGRRAGRRARLRRRRPDARDARRGRAAARAPARAEGARRQRRRPDAPPAGERAPARALRRRVRRALHDRPAGRLRLPRLSVADPPPHLPAHATTPTCTCAATRRRARRRRRSTWSCSTTSTASTSSST